MRFHLEQFIAALFCVLASCTIASAQLPPFPPTSPTSAEQCQKFDHDVEEFFKRIAQEHEQCLKENKQDQKGDWGQPVCSRSACQNLHDDLYGNGPLDHKAVKEEVSKCFASVSDYLKKQAEAQQEEDQRKAKREEERRAEDQRRSDQALADKAKREALREQARAKADKDRRDADEKQKQVVAESRRQSEARATQNVDKQKRDEEQVKQQKARDALSQLADPFERAKNERRAMHLEQRPDTLVDPFSRSGASSPATHNKETEGEVPEMTVQAFETSLRAAKQIIDSNVAVAKSQMSKKMFEQFEEGAKDTKSVANGLGHIVHFLEYGAIAKDSYEAYAAGDTQHAKYEAEKLVWGAGKNTAWEWSKDAAKEGIGKFLVELFPKTAPYITRAASAGTAFVGTFLYSSDLDHEPSQVISDTSGQFSLEDKQRALFQEWKLYDRYGASYHSGDLKTLIDQTDTVYQQAVQGNVSQTGRVH